MFDRISRSWSLAGQCWKVLNEDPVLMVFPLLSGGAMLLLTASFAIPAWLIYHGHPGIAGETTTHTARLLHYFALYIFYVVNYSLVMFFNTALIAVALRRLEGESPSVRDGLQMAFENLPAILGYALIAATVGTILRVIEERVGLVGRIVVAIIGAGWTLATSMTLPVLVVENVGPVEAISRSIDLLRNTWGENLIGNGGISLAISVVAIPIAFVAVLIVIFAFSTRAPGLIVLSLILAALALGGLSLVSATLHSIYTAVLYRYASGDKDPAGIDQALLAGAFRQR